MDKLIEALQIFLKYENKEWPTHCEHDTLYIVLDDPKAISEEDVGKLDKLGFFLDGDEGFISYKYGSA